MKHIKTYKELQEDLTTMWDPQYANPVFKVRYRSNNDLSTKRAPDTIDKPVNDLIDGISVGDIVMGMDKNDKEFAGRVIRIMQNGEGDNLRIFIESDGKSVELLPSTVRFASMGDKGNIIGKRTEPVDTGNIDYTFGGYDNFQPTTYE